MLHKISRQDCLQQYNCFPLRSYDYEKDEEVFFCPKAFTSYALTLHSKTFRGHIKQLGIELTKLIKQMGFDALIFLGDTELSWLHQDNDYEPAKRAQQYLIKNKIGKRFSGALQVDISELFTFTKHLGWLTRCNASLPDFYFLDAGQNILGSICKYGNLYIDTLKAVADESFTTNVLKTNLTYLDSNGYCNQFGKTSVIAGRRIVL